MNPNNLKKTTLVSVWALGGISLLGLLLTRELRLLTILTVLTLFPLFFYFETQRRLFKIRWLENVLILLFFSVSILRFLYFKDSFLIVLADFLVAFFLLKCAFKKDSNDLMQMIALSFFILLSSSTLALDFTFLFSFTFYIVAATWTLSTYTLSSSDLSLNQVVEPEKQWILIPHEISRYFFQNCWLTLMLAVFFAFSIFVFFPRLSLAVFQGAFLGPVTQTGFSEKIILQKSGKVFKDPTVVMRVQTESDQDQGTWQGYLRGQTLSVFDGKQWTRGPKSGDRIIPSQFRDKSSKAPKWVMSHFRVMNLDNQSLQSKFSLKLNEHSFLKQTIYLEAIESSVLFGAPWILSVTARLPQVTLSRDGSVLRPNNYKGRISYETVSLIERPPNRVLNQIQRVQNPWTEETLRKHGESSGDQKGYNPDPLQQSFPNSVQDFNEETALNLQIPDTRPDTIDLKKIILLIGKIVSSKDSNHTKAIKIEKHLRENYQYTLDLKGKETTSPLEDFLWVSKQGHCEYFASAMVLMLRLEGIPARIVTGFLVDEKNPTGNYYVVRAQDAHSWVEARLNGIWVDFDPTPRARRYEREKISAWSMVKQKIDNLNFLWNMYVLNYDMDSQEKFAHKVELESSQLSMNLDLWVSKWRGKLQGFAWHEEKLSETSLYPVNSRKNYMIYKHKTICKFMLILLIIETLLFYAFRNKLKHYISKLWNGKMSKNTARFYPDMLNLFAKNGWIRKDWETPYEFMDRVLNQLNSVSNEFLNPMNSLTTLFYKARFSEAGLSAEDILTAQSSLEAMKRTLPGIAKKIRYLEI